MFVPSYGMSMAGSTSLAWCRLGYASQSEAPPWRAQRRIEVPHKFSSASCAASAERVHRASSRVRRAVAGCCKPGGQPSLLQLSVGMMAAVGKLDSRLKRP
jgi:hypothetical protein